MRRIAGVIILWMCVFTVAHAQPCTGTINSFPYSQDFEATDGGWIPGGTASDWAWGTPNKPVITGAGQGSKCWIAGELTNTGYNSGENSWLMSPCFDFTALSQPEINLKIFWETERRFDGASLQYSTDGGSNWTLLGSTNSNTCDIINWYNEGSVTYLGGTMGWSGSVNPDNGSCLGGNGNGIWMSSKHPLNMLAGQSNVRFRFRFGAGTQCNSFDGFAVDEIVIKEAVAPPASIIWACRNDGWVDFRTTSSCIRNYQWNFGDPSSGTNNGSVSSVPSHQFSAPGEYLVSLEADFGNGVSSTLTSTLTILGATKSVSWPGACSNTPNATLTVTPAGSNTAYFYYWETNPPQTTQSISNVGAGTYTVVISSQDACGVRVQFDLLPPTPIVINPSITNASCNNTNGGIGTNVSGGSPPYSYQWSNGGSGPSITNLSPGNYQLTVTDNFGCISTGGPYTIMNENNLSIDLGRDRNICPGQSLSLTPGAFASYRWQDGSTAATFLVSGAGSYFVDVTDALGCMASDTIRISADCSEIYFPSAFTPNNDTKNDLFGPLGNIGGLQKYSLQVFNRYGQLVFTSSNPLQKWDGRVKSLQPDTGSFVWIAEFELNGKYDLRKGSVLLIR